VIERVQLLRNVGQFDSVSVPSQLTFAKVTLFYAENGRGKTTLAAILRSLASGDPKLITERRRLSATEDPHIIVNVGTPLIFDNGHWSSTYSNIAVFDDAFVSENVCSGVDIGSEHRQNLHELILGVQGVSLNAALQAHVENIEEHNRALKIKCDAIPASERGALTADAFCALKPNASVAMQIQQAERSLSAARSAESVAQRQPFTPLTLPTFDKDNISGLLLRDLPALDVDAAARVQAHLRMLGRDGESWVGKGMALLASTANEGAYEVCPFCSQDLNASTLMEAYRSYFGEDYAELKRNIEAALAGVLKMHGGDATSAFERAVRIAVESREFWKTFVEVPDLSIDTAAVARAWNRAKELIVAVLTRKKDSPLDPFTLSVADLQALTDYETAATTVAEVSKALQAVNPRIAIIKEQAASANVVTLAGDLAKLRATQARHSPATSILCKAYLDEKAAKKITESLRDGARQALDVYRTTIFPTYESAINGYLQRFNAGFRLSRVESVNNRGGSSCTYNVLINNVAVAITGPEGDPCFRNTLSAGDRNTLALAFFFASLDQDAQLAQKVVVIDDPMTSLDEHRALTTVQETGRLVDRVRQVVVMSHSKPFLCDVWKSADKTNRAALKIVRAGNGSTLVAWNVTQDLITEHDRRYAAVTAYIDGPISIHGQQGSDERSVAASLRHILEAYLRVAYPNVFPPGSLLGNFHDICVHRLSTAAEVLNQRDTDELRDLLDYANKFHHETNLAYETEHINDQQLVNFCRRTILFTSRR
jgi:wobble nucleotide-excising tRNase